MKPFTPSLDWGNEVWASLWWIVQAWAYAAVGALVVCALLVRFTTWGRQFWRVTGDYFKGRDSVLVWAWLGLMLFSVMMSVRIDVLLSYYGNDMYSALQTAFAGSGGENDAVKESGVQGFWFAIKIFCILATIYVARIMLDIYLMQRFIIRWRIWLTERLTGDWLTGRAYYRGRFIENTIDNPDQRIQQDVDIFTTGVGGNQNNPNIGSSSLLLFGAIESLVSVVAFTSILWELSGPLNIFGFSIPHALFWIALIFVFVTTAIAFWIGRPFIALSFRNELTNAAFRYALIRLRDAGESVAFYRGERAEAAPLSTRFRAIIDNYRDYLRRTIAFTGWNFSASQAIAPVPYIVQGPRLFAGEIAFGGVRQSADAFSNIQQSLSFFRNAYDNFASYRAAIVRLHGLVEANEEARGLPELTTEASADNAVEVDGVEVRTPSGTVLVDNLDLRLSPGEAMVITGSSGVGKTSLLRSFASLWPFASGTLRRPDGDHETMFLGQLPYVPLGDLRAVVSYPAPEGAYRDAELQQVLVDVALPHLVIRLTEVQDWAKVLSPGEQQRIAFARVLLTRPKAVFLDEATSALDEGMEHTLYDLVRSRLPDCIVVSVSHHRALTQHHDRRLELLGEGAWRLGPVGEVPAQV